jgi:hypothetical protein
VLIMRRFSHTVLLSFACTHVAAAQQGERAAVLDSSSPASIMGRVGKSPGAYWFQDILRQTGAAYPATTRDALADSLVARAVDPAASNRQSAAYGMAGEAVYALARAGARWPKTGRRYDGMFDRMVTVHRRAMSPSVRRLALFAMLESTQHTRAIAYLRQVAESDDSTAYSAIDALNREASGPGVAGEDLATAAEREQSRAALFALWARRRVTNRMAYESLAMWIAWYQSHHPSDDGS